MNNNLLSFEQQKKLRNAIAALAYCSTYKRVWSKELQKNFYFKLNLITLTLPARQTESDEYYLKECLQKFLVAWKKRRVELQYVWKAEKQDNGNIHFHLTTNTFIHHKDLRLRWNKTCKKAGLTNLRNGLQANSTDVHSIKNIKNIAAYLTSYISKKDLYTKTLKRYFKIYSKYLKSTEHTQRTLPANYFKHLKGKVTCTIYATSKALQNAKTLIPAGSGQTNKDEDYLFANSVKIIQDDFFCCFITSKKTFDKTKIVSKNWYDEMNRRFKAEGLQQNRYRKIDKYTT